jgi:hypothetical protein
LFSQLNGYLCECGTVPSAGTIIAASKPKDGGWNSQNPTF